MDPTSLRRLLRTGRKTYIFIERKPLQLGEEKPYKQP